MGQVKKNQKGAGFMYINKEIKIFSQKWQLSQDLEEVKYQANNNTNNSNTVFSCILAISLMVLIYKLHSVPEIICTVVPFSQIRKLKFRKVN